MTQRIREIDPEGLTGRTRKVWEAIAGPREGMVDGPFRAWLPANAELADRMRLVADELRTRCGLEPRIFELTVLTVARFWRSEFQWSAHFPMALRFGVTPETIAAIWSLSDLASSPCDERLAYQCARALLEKRSVPDPLYDALLRTFGVASLTALITIVGQYSLANIVTAGFNIGSIDGKRHFD